MRSLIPSLAGSFRLALALGVLVAIGCGERPAAVESTASPKSAEYHSKLEAFWGPHALNVLKTADKLVMHRLARPEDPTQVAPLPLNDYRLQSAPILATAEQREEIKRLLLDPEGYIWEVDKGGECVDVPLMRLEFSRGEEKADVLLQCYCWNVLLYENGQLVRVEDFDHNMPGVVKILKQAFPQDGELQALQ